MPECESEAVPWITSELKWNAAAPPFPPAAVSTSERTKSWLPTEAALPRTCHPLQSLKILTNKARWWANITDCYGSESENNGQHFNLCRSWEIFVNVGSQKCKHSWNKASAVNMFRSQEDMLWLSKLPTLLCYTREQLGCCQYMSPSRLYFQCLGFMLT